MIKFEHNTLVFNSIFSKDDVAEIDYFADYIRNAERERIIKLLEVLIEERSGVNLQGAIALIKGENK